MNRGGGVVEVSRQMDHQEAGYNPTAEEGTQHTSRAGPRLGEPLRKPRQLDDGLRGRKADARYLDGPI